MLDTTNPEIVLVCLDIREAVHAKRPLKPLLDKLRHLVPDAPEDDYDLARQAIEVVAVVLSSA